MEKLPRRKPGALADCSNICTAAMPQPFSKFDPGASAPEVGRSSGSALPSVWDLADLLVVAVSFGTSRRSQALWA